VTEEKSIAVLPFEYLSNDKANAYFAEGMQDEILTRLSKIADLVISRTSTQHYKSAPENLPEIRSGIPCAATRVLKKLSHRSRQTRLTMNLRSHEL
jgi:TolB-like protein